MLPYCSLQLWTRKLYLNRNQVDEYYKLGQDEQEAWLNNNIMKININLSKYNMESWHKTSLNCKQRKYIHRSWQTVKMSVSKSLLSPKTLYLPDDGRYDLVEWKFFFCLQISWVSRSMMSEREFQSPIFEWSWPGLELTAHAALLPFIWKRDNF